MSNLTHDAAIDAICNCASSVSVLSYQEAIEGYFKLRGLLIPPAPSLAAQDGLVEAAQAIIERMFSTYTARNGRQVGVQGDDGEKVWLVHSDEITALQAALSAIKRDKS